MTSRLGGLRLQKLRAGCRASLSRLITLSESSRADHRAEADLILEEVARGRSGNRHRGSDVTAAAAPWTVRIGISGPPGAGKSTLIEALGAHVIEQGHRLAVLAIDPSSIRTGGSILGDKTRMATLAHHPDAYIRPSPTRGALGGVAAATDEAALLCEEAGFNVVIVETVGVGQSEVDVDDLTDMLVLLVAPAGGDELQGVKKGIVELADLVVVNKADGAMLPAAQHASVDYKRALQLLRPKTPGWTPLVQCVSALEREGVGTLWSTVLDFRANVEASGVLAETRAAQRRKAMWTIVRSRMLEVVAKSAELRTRASELERAVSAGRTTPRRAAAQMVKWCMGSGDGGGGGEGQ